MEIRMKPRLRRWVIHTDKYTPSENQSRRIHACIHICCHILSRNVILCLSCLARPTGPVASVDGSANSANLAAAYITVDLQELPSIISLLELPAGAMYLPRRNCQCRCLYVTMLTVACVHTASNLSVTSPSPYTCVCAWLHVCICVYLLLTRILHIAANINTYHRVHVTSCIVP